MHSTQQNPLFEGSGEGSLPITIDSCNTLRLRSDRYREREREGERKRESGKRIKRREGRFQKGDSD